TYPGIDINGAGDIGMSFIQSSHTGVNTGEFMSMYITGRSASAPAGTMQTPVLVHAGVSNNTDGRMGGLSGINADLAGSFFAANEIAGTGGSWSTFIAHFNVITSETDVALDGSGNLVIADTFAGGKTDSLTLSRSAGPYLRVHDPSATLQAHAGETQVDSHT